MPEAGVTPLSLSSLRCALHFVSMFGLALLRRATLFLALIVLALAVMHLLVTAGWVSDVVFPIAGILSGDLALVWGDIQLLTPFVGFCAFFLALLDLICYPPEIKNQINMDEATK